MIWMREVAWGWIEQFETWPLVYQHIRKKGKEYESFLKHVCLLSAFLQQLTYRWLRSQVDDKMLIDSSLNLSFYRLIGFRLLTNHWVMVCLQAIFYLHVYIFLLSEVMMEVFCWPLKLIFSDIVLSPQKWEMPLLCKRNSRAQWKNVCFARKGLRLNPSISSFKKG